MMTGSDEAKESPLSASSRELAEIVGDADHGPLTLYLFDAAQEELTEASCLFYLSEDRLDDLLS